MAGSSIMLLMLFAHVTTSLHAHPRHTHTHHRRQLVLPSVTSAVLPSAIPETSTAEATSGNAAIEDIQDIQQSLSNLPDDLRALVKTLVRDEVMELFQNMFTNSSEPREPTTTSESALTLPIASTNLPSPFSTDILSFSTISTTELAPSASVTPTYIPTSPTDFLATSTRRMTPTRTQTRTIMATGTGVPLYGINGTTAGVAWPTGSGATYAVTLPLTQPISTDLGENTGTLTSAAPASTSSSAACAEGCVLYCFGRGACTCQCPASVF